MGGEELYCFIEERAHYGQIIGITAGCEQMMNHPSVTIQDQQALISSSYTQINAIKNNYNQEAARGGANRHGFFTYYGLGGCLAMPAQNGHHYTYDRKRFASGRGALGTQGTPPQIRDMLNYPDSHRTGVDSPSWRSYKWLNYYRNYHGGYGQNQCLRFPKQRLEDPTAVVSQSFNPNDSNGNPVVCANVAEASWVEGSTDCTKRVAAGQTYTSPGQLLPFGVSVCRACCVAEFFTGGLFTQNVATTVGASTKDVLTAYATDMLCNYPPDADETIQRMTDEQFEELIPRFDMSGAAYNAFQTPNEPTKVMNSNNDNNLFVHGSWCDEAGPARGCARVPVSIKAGTTDMTVTYVYGADLTADAIASSKDWVYTCDQAYDTDVGLHPIGSLTNRDWCPGRPWLATSHTDLSHKKPSNSADHNIIG